MARRRRRGKSVVNPPVQSLEGEPQSVPKAMLGDRNYDTLLVQALMRVLRMAINNGCNGCFQEHSLRRNEKGWWVHRESPTLGEYECTASHIHEELKNMGIFNWGKCYKCGASIPSNSPHSKTNMCAECFGKSVV